MFALCTDFDCNPQRNINFNVRGPLSLPIVLYRNVHHLNTCNNKDVNFYIDDTTGKIGKKNFWCYITLNSFELVYTSYIFLLLQEYLASINGCDNEWYIENVDGFQYFHLNIDYHFQWDIHIIKNLRGSLYRAKVVKTTYKSPHN